MPENSKHSSKRAPTLADVGRLAGVSAMAASTVLNKTKTSARISDETRVKIHQAAAKLGYRPNLAARALLNRRMNTIGIAVVVEDGELNHYFLEVFNGIIEGAARAGQNATVFTLDDWDHLETLISRSSDGRVDGMILIGPVIDASQAKSLPPHTPFVSLHANRGIPGTVNIESAEERGAYEMVSHLISLGHRKILHLGGPRGLIGAERRISGYVNALKDNGIAPDPACLKTAKAYNQVSGYNLISEWLKNKSGEEDSTAIFCASDAIAVGCMDALSTHGIRVPDDISVCGFDDTLAARTTVPQLSTIRQPLREMGVRAVEVLSEQIKSYEEPESTTNRPPIVFPTKMILRASIAPPITRNPRIR